MRDDYWRREATRDDVRTTRMRVNYKIIAAIVVAAIIAIWGLFAFLSGWTSTDSGTITLIRDGGTFDSKTVRQVDGQPMVLQPGSSLTWIGFYSTEHGYPSTQRLFKVSSRPGADSNEVINVPTRDGVTVGVEGTFYFTLNTDPKVLADFDNRYGTRTYPAPTKDEPDRRLHAWEGDDGWTAFLDATLGNLVQNDLRREIAKPTCVDLIASCALAQNVAGQDAAAAIAAAQANSAATDKLTTIQDGVNQQFATDVAADLGSPGSKDAIFTNIRFVISKVTLPDNVQNAINDAQAAFAAVTKAQAGKAAAEIEAQTNGVRQGGYTNCPGCLDIEKLKALPPGLTTYAPGAQYAVGGK
jgi:hypothetical protein